MGVFQTLTYCARCGESFTERAMRHVTRGDGYCWRCPDCEQWNGPRRLGFPQYEDGHWCRDCGGPTADERDIYCGDCTSRGLVR